MLTEQDWLKKAPEAICPAPLPEDPADARLTGLLAPAPHVVPEKKAKKKATGTQKSSRFQVLSDDDSEADSSHKGEEKKKASPPAGGRKKRKASPTREAEGSKKGKTLPPDCSANASDDDEDWPPRAKPLARS